MNVTDIVVLDEIDMMLHRPDTFVGSIEPKTIRSYIFEDAKKGPQFRSITYSPALLKLFDEVLQNCYDHSKRPGGKNLTRIDVTINPMTGLISVADNAGIPVEMHPEYKMYAPCIIFGMLRSSTNYNDSEQREGGGRNGLGAKLTNIFSTMFKVETCDGKNKYEKTYENNRRDETQPKISAGKNRGTKISFIPDYAKLGCTLDDDNYGMIVTRVYEIAACAPGIDVFINGYQITKGFESFVKRFGTDYLYTENTHWRIGVMHSNEGFKHISFCNAIHTWQGGTHVEYLAEQLVEGIREHVKKKTKIDIKPSDLKNHFFLMVDCTVFNPRFSSQTKEHMNLAISSYGTTFRFDDKFFAKLIKSPIVAEIIKWADDKRKLQEMEENKKKNKEIQKSNPKDIDKYEPAAQRFSRHECTLFVCEGDSASNPLLSARDPKKHGIFKARGKPLNMGVAKMDQIRKNAEIMNFMKAMGLEFGNPSSELRYGKIVLATDADQDGMHIRALFLNNFLHYWPHLLSEGRVFFMNTPIIRVTKGKDTLEFFTQEEYDAWAKTSTGKWDYKYLKGLGGHSTAHFKKYMFEDKYLVPFEFDNDPDAIKMINLAFGAPDDKKEWLKLHED
jgi:DNA gyrase/topoisomerase IV subunit B